ncbi:MAG: helix-turn-helix domain-containing protein [Thermoleophilia bacterium]|nr:helix-turn-helix domain-containing protein [Thermoleophilia bacterium]
MRAAKANPEARHSPADWHPEDIKAAVRKTGISLDALGRANGYAQGSIRTVLTQASPRAQAIVAARLGVKPQVIWPSRYDPQTGEPLSGFFSTGVLRSRPGAPAQRQNGEAA